MLTCHGLENLWNESALKKNKVNRSRCLHHHQSPTLHRCHHRWRTVLRRAYVWQHVGPSVRRSLWRPPPPLRNVRGGTAPSVRLHDGWLCAGLSNPPSVPVRRKSHMMIVLWEAFIPQKCCYDRWIIQLQELYWVYLCDKRLIHNSQ